MPKMEVGITSAAPIRQTQYAAYVQEFERFVHLWKRENGQGFDAMLNGVFQWICDSHWQLPPPIAIKLCTLLDQLNKSITILAQHGPAEYMSIGTDGGAKLYMPAIRLVDEARPHASWTWESNRKSWEKFSDGTIETTLTLPLVIERLMHASPEEIALHMRMLLLIAYRNVLMIQTGKHTYLPPVFYPFSVTRGIFQFWIRDINPALAKDFYTPQSKKPRVTHTKSGFTVPKDIIDKALENVPRLEADDSSGFIELADETPMPTKQASQLATRDESEMIPILHKQHDDPAIAAIRELMLAPIDNSDEDE